MDDRTADDPAPSPASRRRRWLVGGVVPAVVGAGATLAVLAGTGNLGGGATRTTVVERATESSATPPRTASRTAGDAAFPVPRGTKSVETIVREASPGVVLITVNTADGGAEGSGFVVDHQGHILTNAHVVAGGSNVKVKFADQDVEPAKVLAADQTTDVAVLKVNRVPSTANPLPLGHSDGLQVGDPVVAIGNPLGFQGSATTGIISALRRGIDSPNGSTISNAIQTDAAINHGNSGGPLLDGQGRVIGINSQIASQSGGNEGIGFAVPIDTIRPVMRSIVETGRAQHAWIGIEGKDVTPNIARQLGRPTLRGVAVEGLDSRGPAKKAGLHPADSCGAVPRGADVIVAIGGHTVRDFADVSQAIASRRVGDRLPMTVLRGGKRVSVELTLANRPSRPQQRCTR